MNYPENNCSWSNLNPKACKNLDSSKIKPFAMDPPSSKSHPALVKERKDNETSGQLWSLVPPHKKPNFPGWKSTANPDNPKGCPDNTSKDYPFYHAVYDDYQSYKGFVQDLTSRWGVPIERIGCVGYIDEYWQPFGFDKVWIVYNENTHLTGSAPVSAKDIPPNFNSYGPIVVRPHEQRRWILNMPKISPTNNDPLSSADGDVKNYVLLLENQLISTWNASGIEEDYSAIFGPLAQRTVLKKPGNVNYTNAERSVTFKNTQNIILALIVLEDRLKQAAYVGYGSVQELWSKWKANLNNLTWVLDAKTIQTQSDALKGATIYKPREIRHYAMPITCSPTDPNYAECMSQMKPLSPPPTNPIPDPLPIYWSGKDKPSWEELFWAYLDSWATYLMLTDDQLLWILAGSVPLTMYCYEVQDFSYLPVILIPALFFNFTKDYIETELSESQTFVDFVQRLAVDFYQIKRDIKGFTKSTIKMIEVTLLGGALMMGTTFLGAKIPLIEPYVMFANFGIMGVVTIYDLWEMLPWFLPSIF